MNLLHRVIGAAALCLGLAPMLASSADTWPNRPIRIVTPTPAGVGSDVFARIYADLLGRALKVPVVVENRPGALSTLGTDAVAKARPDGYTILFSTSNPFTMTPFLLPKLPYDPQADLVPVTQALRGGSFIIANASVPANNVEELVALAKKEPGRVSFASYGAGSTAHLGFELFQEAAGIELLHVPFKQSPDAGHHRRAGHAGLRAADLGIGRTSSRAASRPSPTRATSATRRCPGCRRWRRAIPAWRCSPGSASGCRRRRRPTSSSGCTARSAPQPPRRDGQGDGRRGPGPDVDQLGRDHRHHPARG